jgi:hypothetical protein
VLVPVFCCFCVSEKLYRKYSRNWTKQKAKVPNYLTRRRSPKESRRWTKGQPHHVVVRATPRPRHQVVWPPGPPPDIALTPIYSPRRENPKARTLFQKTYCKPPPSSTRDRENPGALPGTLPERGITTGGLLHHYACLRSDAWVVYLGLWVHRSS